MKVSNFGRFARRGMLPLATTQTPATAEAQRVLNDLRGYMRGTSDALDGVEADRSWINDDAKIGRAGALLNAGRRQVAQLKQHGLRQFETEALRLEGDLAHRLAHFEQSWGALAAQRIYRRAENLAKQMPTVSEASAMLESAVLKRDPEALAVAYAAGVEGASHALSRYLLGDEIAAKTESMKRDRLLLDLAFKVGELGFDELASDPATAVGLTTRPSPDLVLAVAHAGPDALLAPSTQMPVPNREATPAPEAVATEGAHQ